MPARASVPTSTNLSIGEIAGLWIQEGGDKKWAIPMALVAWAESGGNATVVNSIGATGLWQHYPGNPSLKDPQRNARLAISKFNARGLQPWVSSKGTWGKWFNSKSGEVTPGGLSFLKDHGLAKGGKDSGSGFFGNLLGGPGGDAIKGAVDTITDPLEGLIEPIQNIAETFGAIGEVLINPRRILKLILGGIILLWGISKVSKGMGGPNIGRSAKRAAAATATRGASEVGVVAAKAKGGTS